MKIKLLKKTFLTLSKNSTQNNKSLQVHVYTPTEKLDDFAIVIKGNFEINSKRKKMFSNVVIHLLSVSSKPCKWICTIIGLHVRYVVYGHPYESSLIPTLNTWTSGNLNRGKRDRKRRSGRVRRQKTVKSKLDFFFHLTFLLYFFLLIFLNLSFSFCLLNCYIVLF